MGWVEIRYRDLKITEEDVKGRCNIMMKAASWTSKLEI